MIDMLKYYKIIKELDIDIVYSGPLWADGIEGIAATLKTRMQFDELPMIASQSIFSVFVEQMNNMLMYSDEEQVYKLPKEKPRSAAKGVFILGIKNNAYFIQSGNVIKKSKVQPIKERIDYINTLDKIQLRKYYREMIKCDNQNIESRGAGLGLIEIARRASSAIEYNFIELDDDYSFFSMYVTITQGRD